MTTIEKAANGFIVKPGSREGYITESMFVFETFDHLVVHLAEIFGENNVPNSNRGNTRSNTTRRK